MQERPLNPLRRTQPTKDYARLDIPQLIALAEEARAAGNGAEAVECLRAAVRKAPMRQDLRDMLIGAVEARANEAPGPEPLRRMPRAPLFEDEAGEEGEGGLRIEEIHGGRTDQTPPPMARPRREYAFSDEEEADSPRPAAFRSPGSPRTPAARPAAAPRAGAARSASSASARAPRAAGRSSSASRRRAPISAYFFTIAAGLLIIAIVGGAVWAYFQGSSRRSKSGSSELSAEKPEVSFTKDDEAIVETARDYERQNLFVLAIEKLNLLTEGPEKKKLLADTYARQGRHFSSTNKHNEAREAFERAYQNDPANGKLAFDLGYTYYMLGRRAQQTDRQDARLKLDQAERHLKAASDSDPNNLEILDYLAKIEIARGDPPAASAYLRRIVEIDPQSDAAKKARERLLEMGLKE